jgi:serine/threonine protein phosphatase 1
MAMLLWNTPARILTIKINNCLKTLVIGDIHGCYREMMNLIDKAGLADDDQIVALGDIVDRGPDSASVADFFMTQSNTKCLLGNHEEKHILVSSGILQPAPAQEITMVQIPEEKYVPMLQFFKKLPTYMDLPDALTIHGLLEPDVLIEDQKRNVLIGTMSGEINIKKRYPKPWYEYDFGEKPVIAGHHDYSHEGKPLIIKDKVFLIDTACCYGKSLTALLLPEFKLFTVKSEKNYWGQVMQNHNKKVPKT